jgi:ribosomal protein S21
MKKIAKRFAPKKIIVRNDEFEALLKVERALREALRRYDVVKLRHLSDQPHTVRARKAIAALDKARAR